MKNLKLKSAFTLIELLIVIAIIGILMTIVLVSTSGARKSARDTTRKSDLNQYRAALEAVSANYEGKYPSRTAATVISVTSLVCTTDLINFFGTTAECPIDPINTGTYRYYYRSNGTNGTPDATEWILYGGLETGGYWEICSNGKVGSITAAPTDSVCDL
jgi:prepilin-type N-terminal cleavage/methylation domain-containing protein